MKADSVPFEYSSLLSLYALPFGLQWLLAMVEMEVWKWRSAHPSCYNMDAMKASLIQDLEGHPGGPRSKVCSAGSFYAHFYFLWCSLQSGWISGIRADFCVISDSINPDLRSTEVDTFPLAPISLLWLLCLFHSFNYFSMAPMTLL